MAASPIRRGTRAGLWTRTARDPHNPINTAMNPDKVDRASVREFTDLPNVGKATAGDLHLLGYERPDQLAGESPLEMYNRLCRVTGQRHDPCVLDVFMAIVGFINGDPPRPWWDYTADRKRLHGQL